MKRSQLVSQGTIQRMRHEAEHAWNERNLDLCLELLERASRLDPANIQILLQLGRMYGMRYDYAAAERVFDKAIRITPKKVEILAAAAQQAKDFYSTHLAEGYLRSAIQQEHEITAEVLVKLADIYERIRRTNDAEHLIARALQKNPGYAPALLSSARLAARSKQFETAERLLRLAIPKADSDTKIKGWYELGAVLDRQERYDEAMEAFLQAKVILRRTASPYIEHLKRVRKHLAQLRESLSDDLFQRWFEFQNELQPLHRLALLGGHPRSGTTLLEQLLDSHPGIVSAEETTHFTDYAYTPLQRMHPMGTPMLRVLESASKDAIVKARSDYYHASELCIGKSLSEKLLVDKNPSLTLTLPSLARIFPEIKILLVLRDPRDVCLSCFMQPFVPIQQVNSSYLSLDTTVEEYGELMKMWLMVKPYLKSPFLEIRYEAMIDDLELVARNVLNFLQVPWHAGVLNYDQHATQKVVRSPTYVDVTQKLFTRAKGRWQNYEKFMAPHLEKLDPFLKAFGYD